MTGWKAGKGAYCAVMLALAAGLLAPAFACAAEDTIIHDGRQHGPQILEAPEESRYSGIGRLVDRGGRHLGTTILVGQCHAVSRLQEAKADRLGLVQLGQGHYRSRIIAAGEIPTGPQDWALLQLDPCPAQDRHRPAIVVEGLPQGGDDGLAQLQVASHSAGTDEAGKMLLQIEDWCHFLGFTPEGLRTDCRLAGGPILLADDVRPQALLIGLAGDAATVETERRIFGARAQASNGLSVLRLLPALRQHVPDLKALAMPGTPPQPYRPKQDDGRLITSRSKADTARLGCLSPGEAHESDSTAILAWCQTLARQLEPAAQEGSVEDQFILARVLLMPGMSSAENTLAVDWLKRAARQNHAPALFHLAMLYYEGKGVEQSHDKALTLLQHAAELGHPSAASLAAKVVQAIADAAASPEGPASVILPRGGTRDSGETAQ